VRASIGAGHVVKLSAQSASRWYDRLFYDAGLINPVPVPMPRLPARATREARRVAAGFKLLLGLRWLHDPGEPAPFTFKFIAAWCGVTQMAARRALGELVKCGIVIKGDPDHIVVNNLKMNLYTVGAGPWS
jgi:CRP-like cAMP-binding protein